MRMANYKARFPSLILIARCKLWLGIGLPHLRMCKIRIFSSLRLLANFDYVAVWLSCFVNPNTSSKLAVTPFSPFVFLSSAVNLGLIISFPWSNALYRETNNTLYNQWIQQLIQGQLSNLDPILRIHNLAIITIKETKQRNKASQTASGVFKSFIQHFHSLL